MSTVKTTIEIEGKVLPLRLYADGKMQPIKIDGKIVEAMPERKIQQWALDNAKYLKHMTLATIPAFTVTERELTSEELEDLKEKEAEEAAAAEAAIEAAKASSAVKQRVAELAKEKAAEEAAAAAKQEKEDIAAALAAKSVASADNILDATNKPQEQPEDIGTASM